MAVVITSQRTPSDTNGVASSGGISTYSSESIGSASSDRVVILGVVTEAASASINSATIDYGSGDTAMKAGQQGTLGSNFARLFYLAVPTGTTATFKVTYGAAVTGGAGGTNNICVYTVTGSGTTYVSSGQNSSTDMDATSPLTTTGAVPLVGFLGLASCAADTVAKTWAGATGDLDVDAGAMRLTTSKSVAGGYATVVTCTGSTNGEDGALSWLEFADAAAAFGTPLARSSNFLTSIVNPFSPTSSFGVTVGDLVFVSVGEQVTVTTTTCADNLGNSYTALNSGNGGGNGAVKAWFSVVTVAGGCTPSVTCTASAADGAIVAAVFKGPFTASPLDINTTVVSDSAEPYTATTTGTLAQADELNIGYFGSNSGDSPYNTPAPTGAVIVGDTGTAGCSTAIVSLVVSSTSGQAMAVSGGPSGVRPTACAAATFKKGAAGTDLSAAFSAAGAFTASGRLLAQTSATLSAAGALSARSTVLARASATLAATGSFTADATVVSAGGAITYILRPPLYANIRGPDYPVSLRSWLGGIPPPAAGVTQQISAGFSAISGLGATLGIQRMATAGFSATGNLGADLDAILLGAAAFSATGALSAIVGKQKDLAASFSAVGNLGANLQIQSSISASFAAAGSFTADAQKQASLAASFAATASFGATANLIEGIAAGFAATGALNAVAGKQKDIAVGLAATGAFGATLSLQGQIAASFNATGFLGPDLTIPGAALDISAGALATGNLAAVASLRMAVASSFAATGAYNATLGLSGRIAASFAATGSLTAVASKQKDLAAGLSATGGLGADLDALRVAASSFTASGSFGADLTVVSAGAIQQISAGFSATGSLGSDLRVEKAIASSFTATGAVSAVAGKQKDLASSFSATGSFGADLDAIRFAAAGFSATGALSAVAGKQKDLAASFAASGGLAVTARMNLSGASSFTATGSLGAQLMKAGQQAISAGFAATGALNARVTGRLAIATSFSAAGSLGADARITVQRIAAGLSATGSFGADATVVPLAQARPIAAGLSAVGSFGADAQVLRFIARADISDFISAYGGKMESAALGGTCLLTSYEGECFISAREADERVDEDGSEIFIRTAA